jgi:putative hydrolase of the HAD superfamily
MLGIDITMPINSLVVNDITTIFFDMNGTLRKREPHEATQRAALQRILDLLGKQTVPDGYWEELTERQKAYSQWAQENLLQSSEEEIWTRWILPDEPRERIAPIASELMLAWGMRKGHTIPQPGAQKTITELKHRGYRLGVISNSMSTLDIPQSLQAFEWKGYFEAVVISSEFKHRKPAPEPFLEAARVLNVLPAHCAYVGNRISKDLVGCKQAGFALGILLDPSGESRVSEKDQITQPDLAIRSLSQLLEVFPGHSQMPNTRLIDQVETP